MIRPVVPPTIPVGGERVRVCLHANNTFKEIDGLIASIAQWLRLPKDSNENSRVERRDKSRL